MGEQATQQDNWDVVVTFKGDTNDQVLPDVTAWICDLRTGEDEVGRS